MGLKKKGAGQATNKRIFRRLNHQPLPEPSTSNLAGKIFETFAVMLMIGVLISATAAVAYYTSSFPIKYRWDVTGDINTPVSLKKQVHDFVLAQPSSTFWGQRPAIIRATILSNFPELSGVNIRRDISTSSVKVSIESYVPIAYVVSPKGNIYYTSTGYAYHSHTSIPTPGLVRINAPEELSPSLAIKAALLEPGIGVPESFTVRGETLRINLKDAVIVAPEKLSSEKLLFSIASIGIPNLRMVDLSAYPRVIISNKRPSI